MAKNKNKRKKQKRKLEDAKGTLMKIKNEWQPVTFSVNCSVCDRPLNHLPIRIPKPKGWEWEGGNCKFDVFYCCVRQSCVESATNTLREAVIQGIKVKGQPDQELFLEEEE